MIPFAKWLAAQPGHPTRAAYPIVSDPFADPPVTTAEKYLQQHGVQTVYANFKKPYPATIGTRGLEAAAQVVARTHPDIVFLGSIAVGTVQAFMSVFQHTELTPPSTSSPPPARTRAQRSSARSGPVPPWARWSPTDGSAASRTRSAT